MKFLRNLLAAILGSIIGVGLLFFLLFVIFAAIGGSMSEKEVTVKKNSVLTLDFSDNIVDRAEDNPFSGLDLGFIKSGKEQGLNDILYAIEKAKRDKRIKGIVLKSMVVNAGFGGAGTIKEIRKKLKEFKETGKFIYAYNQMGYSQKGYWLAAVADSVFIHPEGFMMINGFGGTRVFYTDMFKKIGVEPQVIRHGKFKAAIEPFILKKMSPENREQTMRYTESLWQQCLEDISLDRGITVEQLNKLADDVVVRDPHSACEQGLVDAMLYQDEFTDLLKKKLGIEEGNDEGDNDKEDDKKKNKINYIALSKYKDAKVKDTVKISKDKIAVIYAEGEINVEGKKIIGPQLAETIRKVRENKKVKAVVLRVNSPGGSALVSDYIWREVVLLKKEKPVVASFGNVAASGGYYISCAADTIVAEPTTITGSIGVFGLLFSGEELIQNKIGFSMDSFGTNKHAEFGGTYPLPLPAASRPLNSFEKNIIQQGVEKVYDTFISHVAEGRGMTKEQVDAIGQGRVWIGTDAKELGLVDVLGGLNDAIRIAKDLAGIEGKAPILEYPKEKDPIEELFKGFSSTIKTRILKEELGHNYIYYNKAKKVLSYQGIQALLPYEVTIE